MRTYEIVRSTHIDADPARVHDLVNNLHEWTSWSPWEELDASMSREYTGPDFGVGAHYRWSGNRRAGAGTMEIVSSDPERIGIRLSFLKPFKAVNEVQFRLTPNATGTDVDWQMTGEQRGVAGLLGRVVNMDKLVGRDFEKGLFRLKQVAES